MTTFTYDTAAQGIGQLAREAGPGFERRYFYDALARPAATAETHGFHVFSTSRGYDLYSRPESVTYPSGFATRQVYNASGHLSEVQNGANPSTLYWRALQVNARGQVTQEALGNGIVTDRTFEAETGIIQGITSTLNTSGDVQKLGFTFDLIGNLTERRDKRFSTHFVEGFGYDTLNYAYSGERLIWLAKRWMAKNGEPRLYLSATHLFASIKASLASPPRGKSGRAVRWDRLR